LNKNITTNENHFKKELIELLLQNIHPNVSIRNTIEKCIENFDEIVDKNDFSYLY
jgi:hypothetical protein